ncbi:hypothetical protein [Candidatus Pelagibacter bacterium nBUS_36]|uniref:hypothetical protein n=1 Tax=Candidatus Pelagibacter bacterium nBUS_36 TaxID=3374194 RepID=UPI003EBD091E
MKKLLGIVVLGFLLGGCAAQETKETEVKKSFWDSFKEKTGIDMSTGSMQFKKGHKIKVYKKE